MLKTRILHFLGVFLFSGVIIGTPFTVQAIANSTHVQQNHDKDKHNNEDKFHKNKNDDNRKDNDRHEDKDKDNDKKHLDCDDRNKGKLCITPTPPKRRVKVIKIIREKPVFIPISSGNSNTNIQNVQVIQTSPQIIITNNNKPDFSNSNTITINNNTKTN